MDLPVWQTLYNELGPERFVVIAVAFDSGGEASAGPWIKMANPTYPCPIDREHLVAELYDMINVPTAVWIDERGRIVRPSEPAGVSDAFRTMDRRSFSMPKEAMDELQSKRKAYLDAIRDWVINGQQSRFALKESEVLERMRTPNDDQVRAAANFRIGEYLFAAGRKEASQKYFEEAKRLRPESWNYKRQAWCLEDPMKPMGPEFWKAVDDLGTRKYYPEVKDI